MTPSPCLELHLPGVKVPSWNALLAMGHWQRKRAKQAIQQGFLSALLATGNACLTRTTSVRNGWLTAYDTLASYLATRQTELALRRAKLKLAKENRKKQSSK